MTLSDAEVLMMRLIKQATALGLVVAQDYQTRDVMVFAPTGEVHIHHDVAVVRAWMREYALCGRSGRQCFVRGWQRCRCVPVLTATYQIESSYGSDLCA